MTRILMAVLVAIAFAALVGCTSTQETLQSATTEPLTPPATLEDTAESDTATALTDDGAPAGGAEAQVTALAASTRIQVGQVIGAPSGAVQAMTRRIQSRTSAYGIGLVPAGAPGATHNMKGYFSAITESGKTTVIFVWDVFDASGNRLHRIQGQESAPGSSPDGWSSVSSGTMEAIGTRTVDEFATWVKKGKKS